MKNANKTDSVAKRKVPVSTAATGTAKTKTGKNPATKRICDMAS
jgi:hypothetical protein